MPAQEASPFDRHMMAIALRLAKRGLGQTAPNPAVGAVIADEAAGEVIARGWTQPGGRPHAETEALKHAGAKAKGATMYVTLEPCAHHGATPPCADAIVAAGLKRVVVGIEDPDPRTAGQGIAKLRTAGIAVETGVLADEAGWVTLGHILRVTERRPLVQVKIALGSDGTVPRGEGGRPTFVTGTAAVARGHLMRAEADAILVGARTVADDDPELNCRLPGLAGRSPIRIVLSRDLAVPEHAKLLATAHERPLWVFCAEAPDAARRARLAAAGAEIIPVSSGPGGVSLPGVMTRLAERGVTRLLVEGGPRVWRAFAEAGLVDEAVVFRAGHEAAGQDAYDVLRQLLPSAQMSLAAARRIGDDTMHVFRRG